MIAATSSIRVLYDVGQIKKSKFFLQPNLNDKNALQNIISLLKTN